MLVKAADITVELLNEYRITPSELNKALTDAVGPGRFVFEEMLLDYTRQKGVRILIDDEARIWRDHPGDTVIVRVLGNGPKGYLQIPLSPPFTMQGPIGNWVPEPPPPPNQTPPQLKLLLL